MRWITGPNPKDPNYTDKQNVIEYFDRLYDVRAKRISRQDARIHVDDDHSRLSQTLRWLLMPNRPPSKVPENQDVNVGRYYQSSTDPARRWFKEFLRRIGREGIAPYDLMMHMQQRADRINL